MTEPYKTLGVTKESSVEDIRKAYKKLARKYHPDLNPGNKDSEGKFKEVAHAFDLIGTKEAKEKFDRGETEEQFQGHRERPFYGHSQGQHGRYSSTFDESFNDDIFSQFFSRRSNFPGEDRQYQLEVDFLEAAKGAERIITLPNGKKLQVKIPAGIHEGQKLKFAGQGEAGIGNGPPGDAYVEIKIRPSEDFKREGKDILSELAVSLFEAVNGAEVEVKTIDGPISLKIPAGVSSGTKLRIKEKGAGSGLHRGHHVVQIKVVTPKDPPQAMKEAFKNLEKQFAYNPRVQV
jgi:DnaJ-class molecular chaperone